MQLMALTMLLDVLATPPTEYVPAAPLGFGRASTEVVSVPLRPTGTHIPTVVGPGVQGACPYT